jgi:hypothetical protein
MANAYDQMRHIKRSKKYSKGYQQRLIIQKLMGLGLLAVCALIVLMACNGRTVEDRDCTAILLFAPMAFYLLFTKEVVID